MCIFSLQRICNQSTLIKNERKNLPAVTRIFGGVSYVELIYLFSESEVHFQIFQKQLNNQNFGIKSIVHRQEIKDTTESNTSASYLDCYLCIDNGTSLIGFITRGQFQFSHC